MTYNAAKRNSRTLFGRAQGVIDRQVKLFPKEDASPHVIILRFTGNRIFTPIPSDANVHVYFRLGLRIMPPELLGTVDQVIPAIGDGKDTHTINLRTKFGDRYGEVKWQLKITDSNEPGRVYAWTRPKKVESGPGIIADGQGAILRISKHDLPDMEAWRVAFDDDVPTIQVDSSLPGLYHRIKNRQPIGLLIVPSAVSEIMNEMLISYVAGDLDDPDDSTWQGRWLRWTESKLSVQYSLPQFNGSSDDIRLYLEWKETVHQKLCKIINQKSSIESEYSIIQEESR